MSVSSLRNVTKLLNAKNKPVFYKIQGSGMRPELNCTKWSFKGCLFWE